MRLGIIASSVGESSYFIGIPAGLSFGFGAVMSIVMYSVTGCIAASPTSFSRTQGISARVMFN